MFILWKVLSARNAPPAIGLHDEVAIDCRVGLTDIDLNLHLNNAKYLKYMDLARLDNMLQNGLMWKFIHSNTRPIITNTEISYIRELRTFQRFSVSARLLGHDDKYLYSEQRFTSDGRLCTHAFTRFATVHKGRARPAPEVLAYIGIEQASPPLPEPVLIWRDMLDAKKQYALGQPKTVKEKQNDVA